MHMYVKMCTFMHARSGVHVHACVRVRVRRRARACVCVCMRLCERLYVVNTDRTNTCAIVCTPNPRLSFFPVALLCGYPAWWLSKLTSVQPIGHPTNGGVKQFGTLGK